MKNGRRLLLAEGFALAVFAIVHADSLPDHITAGTDCDSFRYVAGNGANVQCRFAQEPVVNRLYAHRFCPTTILCSGAGMLNKGEARLELYADGDLIPQPTMLSGIATAFSIGGTSATT